MSKVKENKMATVFIPDISQALSWLDAHSDKLKSNIFRGIEREALRIRIDGAPATDVHPLAFGSALTHRWITTDFAETLLEMITPVDREVDHLLAFLRDLHRHVTASLDNERMWPLSMPYRINEDDIQLANYGTSHLGQMKTLYRKGLKNRYGALTQIISGVHYNFSLPLSFWQAQTGIENHQSLQDKISAGYLHLIRNYLRFGWIIPYLFGASPAICSSFLQGKEPKLAFSRTDEDMLYLPYATSLRLSDLGYTNQTQQDIGITFNTLTGYLDALRKATRTPSERFTHLGMRDAEGNLKQINTNILQLDSEFYAPIRPKRSPELGESASSALLRAGIQYIEVRSLDVNPFSEQGIDAEQVRFLDLFLIWCLLVDSPEKTNMSMQAAQKNWNTIIFEGRKPGQTLDTGDANGQVRLADVGMELFRDLYRIAEILDHQQGGQHYQKVCSQLVHFIEDPTLTYSARILSLMIENGLKNTGLMLAEQHHHTLTNEPYRVLNERDFSQEAERSINEQREIEAADAVDFETFLSQNT